MKEVDFIIVGAGLAGSLLALELEKNGFSFQIIHYKTTKSASQVAIGLVNPITGKRLVKSWLIDQLIPYAKRAYLQLENQFDSKFLFDCTIARIIPNQIIFDQWKKNFDLAVKENYINPEIKSLSTNNKQWNYFEILQCFWVDVPLLVTKLENYFEHSGKLTNDKFDHSKLRVNDRLTYKNIKAKDIIFCEGWKAIENPFFNHLPFNVNKGEVTKGRIKGFDFNSVLKKNIFILPDKHDFKIGSTYDRNGELNTDISKTATAYFHNKLEEIGLSAELYDQKASIRPATVDRRPFIGPHNVYNNLYIFNGFGAKGVSLIPFFTNEFVLELKGQGLVNKEASTRRFVSP